MKSKKVWKITGSITGTLLAASLAGIIITGVKTGWGPFGSWYDWDSEVNAVAARYPVEKRRHEIIFYGASNFRMWTEMENDLAAYRVQNHGFGGSTDKLLVEYADILLYPYQPDIVFFQTGSNDYVSLSGTDEEKADACMGYKQELFRSDGIHLNRNGQLLWMEDFIQPALEELVQEFNLFHLRKEG